MKRAGFTMIELIFVIVNAQLANANENICVNLKGPLLSYAVRHGGSLKDANLSDYSQLQGWTKHGTAVLSSSNSNLVGINANPLGGNYALSNPTNKVYIYFVDGNDTTPYGCFIGNKASSGKSAQDARNLEINGSNYL